METGTTLIDGDLGSKQIKKTIPNDPRNFITMKEKDFYKWLERSNKEAEKNKYWKGIRV